MGFPVMQGVIQEESCMKRVLIAEDDMVGRYMMSEFLGMHAQCVLAVDGLEALNLFAESVDRDVPFDLILLDIMMPQLDGLKVLKAIRGIETQRHVPGRDQVKVIMITALNDRKTVMESHELGGAGFVWKPVDLKKLGSLLQEIGFIETEKVII